ncbi:HD domain-containing protein [Candidatus Parcubacteria bacterium]|nr:HD domain-containing protein [Candidatus Parcubacteria bacterium]
MARGNLLKLADLDLKEMVAGIGNQLRYVDRFATCRRNHRENVAEHQFYTAFFTLLIGVHLTAAGREFDFGMAVVKGLIHDVEEHYTGDVVRPVKHANEDTKQGFEKTGADFTVKFFRALTKDKAISHWLFATWRNAKDRSDEGFVVKFADFLSVLAYLDQEIRSGNYLVMSNVIQLKTYRETFEGPDFDFIRPLVDQSYKLVDYLDNAIQRKRRKQ